MSLADIELSVLNNIGNQIADTAYMGGMKLVLLFQRPILTTSTTCCYI